MSLYQVIAKKFRPQKFAEVFEQQEIVQTLKNAIRMERIGHAYLFCGTRGTGKTTLARLFAKAINCEAKGEEPCNVCTSCQEITSGHSLDVIEIDGASNRGIDDIRNLNETIGYAPSRGRYKIYIIDEVHMLTKEAFNALLKTLEEPPSHAIFFFATTEPHKVLPTILSRCQRFDLRRITPEKIEQKLSSIVQALSIDVEKGALQLIAAHAEGSLRDAESLLDQLICYEQPPITREHATKILGLVESDLFFKLDEAMSHDDTAAAFTLADTIFKRGCHLHHFLESLAEHFRTIALTQMGHTPPLSAYTRSAQLYTKHQTLTVLDYLVEALEKAQRTPFKRIHLEIVLLHIIRTHKKISLEALVERLEALKASPQEEAPLPPKAPPEKLETPSSEEPKAEEVPFFSEEAPSISPSALPMDVKQKIKHEQVLRFASVELNGSLKM